MASTIYDLLFQVLGFVCHQLPERSFVLFGAQFPLCMRCTAIFLGSMAAVVYLAARLPLPPAKLSLFLSLPMGIEVALRVSGFIEGAQWLRPATGVVFGFFSLLGVLTFLATWGERSSEMPAGLVSERPGR